MSKILADRPDVFQAFFTEYYGPGNDRSSDAWAQRVGGATDEDYANYWYNAHGRVEGYVPSWPATTTPPASEPDLAASPDAAAEDSGPRAPPREEDPSLDPWNHPAIYPDWQPPYPGWQAPGSGGAVAAPAAPDDDPYARPPVVHHTDDGIGLLPATHEEIAAMRSLFEDAAF